MNLIYNKIKFKINNIIENCNFSIYNKIRTRFLIISILINISCNQKVDDNTIDYQTKDLGKRGKVVELSCKYSCKVKEKKIKPPKGIENESNFCYLISLLQVLASIERYYDIFKEYSCNDKIAKKCYKIIKKLRNGGSITKNDIRQLLKLLKEKGWLCEHHKNRNWNDPRDPSLLLKFLLGGIAKKYFKLTSIIKNSKLNKRISYCTDQGKNYDNIQISCSVNNFEIIDPEVLVVVSVYNDKDLKHSITYKSSEIIIPKEHANTTKDLKYVASGFVQVKDNGGGGNHATAFTKKNHNKWFYCNDKCIYPVNSSKIDKLIASEDTVLVIYERVCENVVCDKSSSIPCKRNDFENIILKARKNYSKTCSICLKKRFKKNEEISICRGGGKESNWHMFHKDCIFNWLKQKNNCPVCRRTGDNWITKDEYENKN